MSRVRALVAILLLGFAPQLAAFELKVTAPDALADAAERVRRVDQPAIDAALSAAGLTAPPVVQVTLLANDDPRGIEIPRWIVGYAFGTTNIVIFPSRVGSYPYDSIETVLTHEIAHLALSAKARGEPLPRWFHEGVAVSVESGWGLASNARLLLAALADPDLDDLAVLFASDSQLGNADAYSLATAFVADVRERHGAAVPGAIAERVANGLPFAQAFTLETGETPDAAAAQAWATYRRWTTWLPILTDGSILWGAIVLLASVAFIARRRKRARRRAQWDEEERFPRMDER